MFWKKGDWVSMNLKKSVITSIRTSGDFSTDGLVKHTSEMNRRIEKNIQKNEKISVLKPAACIYYFMIV